MKRNKVDMGVDIELPWRKREIHLIMIHFVTDARELERLARKARPVGNVLLGMLGDKGKMQSDDPVVFVEGCWCCGGGFGGSC